MKLRAGSLWALIILFSFFLLSCTNKKKAKDHHSDIHWQKSGMPEALKLAKKEKKPLFVYWGAVWCPPCNVLKSTLFTEKKFTQATQDYVSVYLDGDTEEAQSWGETLKVMGYPTLMLLTPEGQEIMRLSPYNTTEDLVNTMGYVKNQWSPISETLDQLLAAGTVDVQKLKIISNYSWSQDKDARDNPKKYFDKLYELDKKLVDPSYAKEKSQIFMSALSLELNGIKEKEKLSVKRKNELRERVEAIVKNPAQLEANVAIFAYDDVAIVNHLTQANVKKAISPDRKNFITLYLQKLKDLRSTATMNYDNYYSTYYPIVDFHKEYQWPLEESDKKALVEYSEKALATSKGDAKKRVALMSHITYLLFQMGEKQKAKDLLLAEMKTAINPYYLMSTMGYFEKEEGQKSKALEWYEKAYKAAEGPATQLQWYGNYIKNLIKLAPEKKSEIKQHVQALMQDYTKMADAYLGRNYRVLESVKKSLTDWSKDKKDQIWMKSLKKEGLNRCLKSDQEIHRKNCEKFYKAFI